MSTSLFNSIDSAKLPEHIAIIMDGNGRWAKSKGMPRVYGHKIGVNAVREITEAAAEAGIKYLTLYAFSTENWNRPKLEVNALMALLVETIKKEVKTLNKNNIRLNTIGDISKLPSKSHKALEDAIAETAGNDKMVLNLALNYSAKWEILQATKDVAQKVKEGVYDPSQIDETIFSQHLSTAEMPDPELLIRTSGEKRVSNYLLWQIAYAELYFTDVYWPDFGKEELYKAILEYQNRERRFGKTSEQLT